MERGKEFKTTLLLIWGLVICLNGARLEGMPEANTLTLAKLPFTFDFDGPYYPEPNLVFDGPFSKVAERMMVYKVKDPNVTEASVRRVAEEYFDIPADAELTRSRGMGLYWLKSGNTLVEVNPLTGWLNVRKIRRKKAKTIEKSCPSKEEGKNIVAQYLKTRGLLPKDAYLWRVVRKQGKGVVRAAYKRKIGGYKSYGAGAKILVTLGPGGEVIDLRKHWQELVPYKAYPIKSAQEALAELQQGKGVLMNGDTGKVKEITLRYYTSPQKQEYVQPIYYFECSGDNGRFNGKVPAIKAEYLKPREDTTPKPMTWIKCRNPQCKAQYQITLKEYFEHAEGYLKEHPNSLVPPSLACEKCEKETAYRALKCEKCGLIFEAGWRGPDYYDRCPKCKFSKVEEKRKKTR